MSRAKSWTIRLTSPDTFAATYELRRCRPLSIRYATKCTQNKGHAIAGRTARCRLNIEFLRWNSAVSLPQHGFLCIHQWPFKCWNNEITHSTLIFTTVTQNHGDSRQEAQLLLWWPIVLCAEVRSAKITILRDIYFNVIYCDRSVSTCE